ncbi:hypothetical protein TPY_0994 [Sulfobacillus acidophilus TPY]|uniref:Uncharacterized protein n=1 Tax=Sulfobacillus acidophilus (strain ATCC 700253 / DSM 10332 / NAL) TaxID=679936 RepID=G8TXB2_SULAD|nr:hypothetical protein TPY_0994 [Sulfobacillus acidophilus TPY]AEW06114.1 hypothetical protein Sulac_2652 [Sulfobacillus acidophilus DSM 10332]
MNLTPSLNPVAQGIRIFSGWLWQQLASLSEQLVSHTILAPLAWPRAATAFYYLSLHLCWGVAGLLLILGIMRLMWPQMGWSGLYPMGPWEFVERTVVAAVLGSAGLWTVHQLLGINDGMVLALKPPTVAWPASPITASWMSPLLVLVFSLLIVALVVYLAVFYAIRSIEILLLTALLPWGALLWATGFHPTGIGRLFRELVALIFVQSLHAGVLWIAWGMLGGHALNATGLILEVGLLWYMTKIPTQFRHLIGRGW